MLPAVTDGAVRLTDVPEHTTGGGAVTTVGLGLNETATALIAEHPDAVVPFI
ncbi:hypothetical protein FLCH110379_18160 [Flavobacterium chungbukense]